MGIKPIPNSEQMMKAEKQGLKPKGNLRNKHKANMTETATHNSVHTHPNNLNQRGCNLGNNVQITKKKSNKSKYAILSNDDNFTPDKVDKYIQSKCHTSFTRFIFKLVYHIADNIKITSYVLVIASITLLIPQLLIYDNGIEPGTVFTVLDTFFVLICIFLGFIWWPLYSYMIVEIFPYNPFARECMMSRRPGNIDEAEDIMEDTDTSANDTELSSLNKPTLLIKIWDKVGTWFEIATVIGIFTQLLLFILLWLIIGIKEGAINSDYRGLIEWVLAIYLIVIEIPTIITILFIPLHILYRNRNSSTSK